METAASTTTNDDYDDAKQKEIETKTDEYN